MSWRVHLLPWKSSVFWLFIPLHGIFNALSQIKEELSFYSFDIFLRIEIKSGVGKNFVMFHIFFKKRMYIWQLLGLMICIHPLVNVLIMSSFSVFSPFCLLFLFFTHCMFLKIFPTDRQYFALCFEAFWIAYFLIMLRHFWLLDLFIFSLSLFWLIVTEIQAFQVAQW